MPKWPLIAIACVILGLASGVGFALVREYLRRTVIRPSQAERLSGVPVVGLAPAIHGLSKRLETAWFDEELRRWVADLRPLGIPHNGKTSQVIFVTSARAGEGKSTIASHLAASISGTVGKVLLIEAEAPRPDRLHRFGLLDVLRQKAGLHRVLGQHPSELFATLPFGGDADIDSQAVGALLGGPKFAEAILACRALYDVIIIDGPAAVDAAYAAGKASVADVTLFVVQWDATDEAFLPYMMDRLHPKAGAIIFNKVNLRRYALLEPFLPGLVERRASAAFKAH